MSSEEDVDSPLGEEPLDAAPNGRVSEDDDNEQIDEEELEDLFGDEQVGENEPPPRRRLDDDELDSGDDEGRNDRAAQYDEDEDDEMEEQETLNILDIQYPRCAAPEPSDGEMYYLKIPHFLEIEAQAFNPKAWTPPTADHHSRGPPSETFSAYNTAMTTIRWRRAPSKSSELQSNARILRWSDGSLTLQLASDPLTQYEIQARALAPPQQNPTKPTPLSHHDGKGRNRINQPYNISQDTFSFLAQPYASPQILRMTNKLTTALSIASAGNITDDALERLQRSMAAARSGTLADNGDFKPAVITEDPELAKKKAELAEREKIKTQRKLEQQQTREAVRMNKARDRVGFRNAGLTVGGLEDDGGLGRRGAAGVSRPKQRRSRHREDWSEDEEGEDYEEDDFVAADDDEEEEDAEGESEDDVDARIEARFREEKLAREQARRAGAAGGNAPVIARATTPKRPAEDDDAGAGGDLSPGLNRHKRRRVVEDDEEE